MLVYKRKREKRHKSAKQMERHLKGVANHRRIEILFLIATNKGITVEDIDEDKVVLEYRGKKMTLFL